MKLFYGVLFSLSISLCYGQEFPVLNQYIFDPYIINPSMVARNGHELNLLYRQQWSGIKDSPTTALANLQYRVSPRIGLGLNVFNDKVVLLSSTSIMGTFGYRIPVSRTSHLSFGLSAGVYSNRIDLNAATDDPTDPVLVKANGTFRMDGQFGLNYSNNNLNLGFSLLHLFDNNPFTEGNFTDLKFNELKNRAFMGSYRFTINPNLAVTPYLQYRYNGNYSYVEGHAMITYKDFITVGGFYRQDYGVGLIFRMKLKGGIEAGYSHEFAGKQAQSFAGGTHELQLKYRFGPQPQELVTKANERTIDSTSTAGNAIATSTKPVENNTTVPETNLKESEKQNPVIAQENQEIVETKAETPVVAQQTEVQTKETTENTKGTNSLNPPQEQSEVKPIRYSLVVGSFKSSSNALVHLREVKAKGLKGEIGFSKETGLYYVILTDYDVDKPSVDELLQLRKKLPYNDAWYLKGIRN